MPLRRVDVRSGVGSDTDIGPDFVELPTTSGDNPRGGSSSASRQSSDTRHPTARTVTEGSVPSERRDTPTARSVKPSAPTPDTWMTHPPTLITGGLTSLIIEVALVAWIGLTRWLLINALIGLVILIAVTVRRLRSSGVRRTRASRAAAAGANRTAGAAGAGRPGLASRVGLRRRSAGGTGASAAGRSGGAAGRGNPLSRLFRRSGSLTGGSTGGTSPTTTGRSGSPQASGRKLWPFGRKGTSAAAGTSAGRGSVGPTGGSSSGSRPAGGRSLWPFRRGAGSPAASRGSSPGASGASRGAAGNGGSSAASAKRSRWRRPTSDGANTKAADKAKPTKAADSTGTKPAASGNDAEKPRRRFWGLWESRQPTDPKSGEVAKKATETATPKAQGADATQTKTVRPETTRARRPEPAPATPVPRAGGRHAGTPGGFMTTPAHKDDSSLQGWGRGLKTIAPAYDELGKKYNMVHAEDTSYAEALRKIAAQAETDLPVAKPLAAEVSAIAAEAQSIAADQEALNARRRRLRDRSEVLPQTYRREHETDEDRINSPRNGRAAERRADVSAAEQDT